MSMGSVRQGHVKGKMAVMTRAETMECTSGE